MDQWVVDYIASLETQKQHLFVLQRIVEHIGEPCEGNAFWNHMTTNIDITLVTKQANLFHFAKDAEQILEIGFNAGHSCFLFLIANPHSKITLFDMGDHKYTQMCYEYLASQFPGRLTIILGDSRRTLPQYIQDHPDQRFDLLHVDGGHQEDVVISDILHCSRLAHRTKNVVISDDDNDPTIHRINRSFLEQGLFQEIPSLRTFTYPHFVATYVGEAAMEEGY